VSEGIRALTLKANAFASRGSEQHQSMNSRMAWSDDRFELAEVKPFRTADFDCSKSGSFRTVFGMRLRLLCAMGAASSCRNEKHDPPGSLVTISAFLGTNPQTDSTSE
jgi:hypothetical protein